MLAQSDQQLVAGIAVLIAGFTNPCSMDMYHFQIVSALAWFSSVTHLATLQLLHNYLIQHTIVRNLRVIAILMSLVLLIVAQTLGYAPVDMSSPAVCGWSQIADIGPEASVLVFEMVLFWTFSYGAAVLKLYSLTSDVIAHRINRYFRGQRRKLQFTPKKLVEVRNTDTLPSTNAEIAAKSQKKKPIRPWTKISKRLRSISWFERFIGRAGELIPVQQEMESSFLNDILGLYLFNSLGIIGVALARWQASVPVNGNENDMGFGQIVPLLLLALPLLAVIEVYDGMLPTLETQGCCANEAIQKLMPRITGQMTAGGSPKTPLPI